MRDWPFYMPARSLLFWCSFTPLAERTASILVPMRTRVSGNTVPRASFELGGYLCGQIWRSYCFGLAPSVLQAGYRYWVSWLRWRSVVIVCLSCYPVGVTDRVVTVPSMSNTNFNERRIYGCYSNMRAYPLCLATVVGCGSMERYLWSEPCVFMLMAGLETLYWRNIVSVEVRIR